MQKYLIQKVNETNGKVFEAIEGEFPTIVDITEETEELIKELVGEKDV